MATTAAGTPYVESSDLVANYPGLSLALANHIDTSTGKVLQVVAARTTTQVTSTTTTYVDTTLAATITPSATTSRILIYSFNPFLASVFSARIGLRLLRDATVLATWPNSGVFLADMGTNVPTSWEDSPSTVSATTYKIQFARLSGSGTAYAQLLSAPAQIILMEIGA
jgi:hypothetical protein